MLRNKNSRTSKAFQWRLEVREILRNLENSYFSTLFRDAVESGLENIALEVNMLCQSEEVDHLGCLSRLGNNQY